MRRTTRKFLALAALGAGAMAARTYFRKSNYRFYGRTVVILGGSRGLGLQLARIFAGERAKIAISARTAQDVERAVHELRLRGANAIGEACDIRDQGQVSRFIRSAAEQWGGIDVLVNNAGVIQTGPQECMTLDDYRDAMETHFWGPLYATLEALPYLRRRGGGRIVNIASIGGKIGVPHMAPYCASKFALMGLSEGLRAELAREGILLTAVCPGMMRTGSPRNADFKGKHRAEYAWFSISDSLPLISIDSGRAARQIVEACRRGDAEVVLSLPAKAAVRFHGLFPGITGAALGLVNRLLPGPGGVGTRSMKGWQSESAVSPSVLTTLTEQAAWQNNEIR